MIKFDIERVLPRIVTGRNARVGQYATRAYQTLPTGAGGKIESSLGLECDSKNQVVGDSRVERRVDLAGEFE